jgi:D-alanyl-D-alanine carboxypeptidase
MISIAASTKPSSFGTDTSTLTAYNRGIKNRVIPEVNVPYNEPTDLASINYNIGLNLGKLTPYFAGLESYFIDGFWFFDKEKIASFDVAKSGDYKNTLKDLIATTKNFFNDANKFSAIIPTKLTFTIDGIGGIIIGTLFKIPPKFIPAGYKGTKGIGRQLGYIVTNLGHNLQNGDWTTDIIAQTIILENVKDEGIGFDYSQILVPLPDGGVEIGVTGPINKGTPSTTKVPDDLKPIGNGEITEDKLKAISTQPKYKLYTAAADAFVQMETDAKKAGFTLPLTSAYRTLAEQEKVYKDYNGVGVAPVGTSPHGWGIAIDISPSHFGGVKRTTSSRVNEVQRQTKLYKWLETNAAKYNFYNPPALQDGQGYDEWWHWEWWG